MLSEKGVRRDGVVDGAVDGVVGGVVDWVMFRGSGWSRVAETFAGLSPLHYPLLLPPRQGVTFRDPPAGGLVPVQGLRLQEGACSSSPRQAAYVVSPFDQYCCSSRPPL